MRILDVLEQTITNGRTNHVIGNNANSATLMRAQATHIDKCCFKGSNLISITGIYDSKAVCDTDSNYKQWSTARLVMMIVTIIVGTRIGWIKSNNNTCYVMSSVWAVMFDGYYTRNSNVSKMIVALVFPRLINVTAH